MIRYFSIIVIFFLFLHCQENTVVCPSGFDAAYEIGYFALSDSTLDNIPYDASTKEIVLTDSTGKQLVGILDTVKFIHDNPLYGYAPCIYDASQEMWVKAYVDWWSTSIRFEQLDFRLSIRYAVTVAIENINSIDQWDFVHVRGYGPDSSQFARIMSIVINGSGDAWSLTQPTFSTVTLNGRMFEDVYVSNQTQHPALVYFSTSQGLVGLQLNSSEPLYVLE